MATLLLTIGSLASNATELKLVSVDGDVLKLNGHVVAAPVKAKKGARTEISLNRVVAVLGKYDRSGYGHSNFHYTWHKHGIILGKVVWDEDAKAIGRLDPGMRNGQIFNIAVYLDWRMSRRDLDPEQHYAGTIVVNGVTVTTQTRLTDIEEALRKQRFEIDREQKTATLKKKDYEVSLVWNAGEDDTLSIFSFEVL